MVKHRWRIQFTLALANLLFPAQERHVSGHRDCQLWGQSSRETLRLGGGAWQCPQRKHVVIRSRAKPQESACSSPGFGGVAAGGGFLP